MFYTIWTTNDFMEHRFTGRIILLFLTELTHVLILHTRVYEFLTPVKDIKVVLFKFLHEISSQPTWATITILWANACVPKLKSM